MAIVKVIELIGESDKGWEDATKLCVEDASATIRDIRSVWVKDMQAVVEGDRVVRYRVNCKVSFVVKEELRHP